MVRLTCLQPSKAGKAADGGNAAKRARTDDEAAAAKEKEGQEKEEEVTLAVRAQGAIEELGAAAGWEEGVKARCVVGC